MHKESLTGYLSKSVDVARFENQLKTQVGTLYYAADIGFDVGYFLNSNIRFNATSFNDWVTSQAMNKGIVIIASSVNVEGFTLKLDYTLANESLQGGSYQLNMVG